MKKKKKKKQRGEKTTGVWMFDTKELSGGQILQLLSLRKRQSDSICKIGLNLFTVTQFNIQSG